MASGLVGLYLRMESSSWEKDLFQGLVEGRLPRQGNLGILSVCPDQGVSSIST